LCLKYIDIPYYVNTSGNARRCSGDPTEKNHHEPLLSDTEWLWKLAFFADLVNHMNEQFEFKGSGGL
jgi:hypothetical protein